MVSFSCLVALELLMYIGNSVPITLYTINCNDLSGSQVLLSETIAGLYAYQRHSASLWMEINGWDESTFWLNNIKQQYGDNIMYNNSFQTLNGVISLTNYLLAQNPAFKIEGYLKAKVNDQSLHFALSLAFHYNALIATDDATENALKASPLNLKLLRDFTKEKNSTYLSIFDEFLSFNGNINDFIIFQDLSKYQYLSDFAIASKSFIFYDNNMNTATVSTIFNKLSVSNKVRLLGWGNSEGDLVGTSSKYNISVVASDWSENLSQFYLLNSTKPHSKIKPSSVPTAEQYHYATFLFTDGDNLQWLQNTFFNPQWYGSNLRGGFPVAWTISGSVQELAATVYNKIIGNATSNDSYAMGPSGYGYEIIAQCNDVKSFAVNTATSIALSDSILQNVNVIDDNRNSNGYNTNINVMLDNSNDKIKSIIYYFGDAYCGGRGKIFFYKKYPIITGKDAMWSGHNTYTQIAQKLNSYPVDPTKTDGYSLIPVHVWSQSMQNVSKCIDLLDDKVKVVGIDDFVDLIIQNIPH